MPEGRQGGFDHRAHEHHMKLAREAWQYLEWLFRERRRPGSPFCNRRSRAIDTFEALKWGDELVDARAS